MNKMWNGIIAAIIFFVILGQPGLTSIMPKTIQLSLNLGAATSGDGDISALIKGYEDYSADLASVMNLQKSGDIAWTTWGQTLGGEIILGFSTRFRLGLGFGLMSKSRDNQLELGPYPLIETKLDFSLHVVPLTLTGYFFFPLSQKSLVYIKGGPACYWGRFTYDVTSVVQGIEHGFEGDIRNRALGFHGGLGIEANLSDHIAFFTEAEGRYVKFTDWTGDETEGTDRVTSAPVWYAEEIFRGPVPDTGQYYPSIVVSEETPQHSWLRNVRRFETDLSGARILAGIRVRFNL